MLETAIILPTVLMFTLGAIDVANYLRSYNAAKEAATAGIRCLYPTDAECTSVTPALSIPQNNLYIPPFFSNHYDYDGREKKLLLPNYSYGALRATVLNTVSFQADRRNWRADKPWFQGIGTAKILTGAIPSISRDPARLAYLRGGLTNSSATAHNIGEYKRCNNLITDANALGEPYGQVQFQVPPFSSILNDIDLDRIKNCTFLIDGKVPDIRCNPSALLSVAKIYFKLNGTATNSLLNGSATNERAAAHLNLRLSWSQDNGRAWKGYRGLGGQDFSTEYSANFWPRGFSEEEIMNSANPRENARDFHGNITAPWGSLVRIELFIRKAAGLDENNQPYVCPSNHRIRWQFDSIDVRFAKPGVSSVNDASCGSNLFLSGCNARECAKGAPLTFPGVGQVSDYNIFSPRCGAQQGVARSATASCTTVSNVPTQLEQDTDYRNNKSDYLNPVDQGRGSCNTSASKACETNFGGLTYEQKKAACPAPDAIPNTENWSEKTIDLLPAGQVKANAQNCLFNPANPMPYELIPTPMHSYLKLHRPTASLTSHTQMDTSSQDPARLKVEPEYSCLAVRTEQRNFAENAKDDFTSEEWQRLLASSFNGPVPQLNCSAEQTLRTEALAIGMSALSFYETIKASVIPNSEYQISPTQIDSCMSVRADESLAATNLRNKVPNGPFDEGIIPSQCLIQGQSRCISIPAGVRQVQTGGDSHLDTTEVRRRAQLAAQAFMPNACPGCITVDPQSRLQETMSEEQLSSNPLEVEVKVKQPLLVLAGKEIDVSYTATRYWEGRYAAR